MAGAVVITGASTGIGKACASHLDRLGFRVFAGVRKTQDGEALKAAASERLLPISLDVTDAASVRAAAEQVSGQVGENGLAGLVNNAGINIAGPLELLPVDELRRQFEINVFGLVTVTQAFLPLLRKGRGRVVNMGSLSGKIATPFTGPYCATKHAVEALTDALRLELRPWGISVSVVEPGAVLTPIWEKSIAASEKVLQGFPPEAHQLYDAAMNEAREVAIKVGRMGIPPERVAEAVTHALTSPRPRTRYPVGLDAKIGTRLARFLPDRIRDRLVMWRLRS
ncbi:MAG: SDR family oxidoreductase [Candidatus Hydrogenedentes bacterium]|nr:SDR family oxidoreductase [Candidatus Hydrogenedentota bacterium]